MNSIPHLLVTLKSTVEPNSLYNLMKVINLWYTVPISRSPQFMRPGIGQNASCAVGDFAYSV